MLYSVRMVVFLISMISGICLADPQEEIECQSPFQGLSEEAPAPVVSLGDHATGLLFNILNQHGLAGAPPAFGKGKGQGTIPEQLKQLDGAIAGSSEMLHQVRMKPLFKGPDRNLSVEELVNSDFASIEGFVKVVALGKDETANPLLRNKYDAEVYRYQQGDQWVSIRLNYRDGELEHAEVLLSQNGGETWLPYFLEKEGERLVSKRKVTLVSESHKGENDVARQCANCHGGFGRTSFGPLVKFSAARPAAASFLPFSRIFSTRPF